MQAIMRYELVINEALRSALMFDTPDEQINEFIRFFGKHMNGVVKVFNRKLIFYKAWTWILLIGGIKLLTRKKM